MPGTGFQSSFSIEGPAERLSSGRFEGGGEGRLESSPHSRSSCDSLVPHTHTWPLISCFSQASARFRLATRLILLMEIPGWAFFAAAADKCAVHTPFSGRTQTGFACAFVRCVDLLRLCSEALAQCKLLLFLVVNQ